MKRAVLESRTSSVWPLILRIAAGGVFLVFGIAKFVNHADEAASFHSYGLPDPDAAVYVIGVVETAGGLMLLAGLLTRVAALMLAGDMIGAIASAGPVEGGAIHLGLAPALLICMLVLLWTGPGPRSLDARLVPT